MTRLSVRRRLPGGGHGDVVGHLIEETQASLTLLPEDRAAVVIPNADVVARREVPPRAVRPSSSADDLARFLARHWPGTEQERLGGWLLRAGGGFTKRANSGLAVGDPGLPPSEALGRVVDWYADRGLPARLQVVGDPVDVPVGWTAVGDVAVLVADARRDLGPVVPSRTPADVRVSDAPSADWLGLWRGGTCQGPRERAVLTASPAHYLLLVGEDGALACARVAVERRWAHVACVEVRPDARGQGLGRAIVRACLEISTRAPFLAVEVEADNTAARGLYTTMGMRERYRYHYLEHVAGVDPDAATRPAKTRVR